MENAGFIFAAYAVIWAVLFGYVLFLVRRQAAIKKQLDAGLSEPRDNAEKSE